jgi:ubiquitin carboxyl-terminal hydrolase 22/27/51
MQFMLNTLHLQNGGSADAEDCDCIVHQTFYGRLSSTVTCDNCRNTTTALDPYMDLSLDIRNLPKRKKSEAASADNQIALQSCLDRFTGREKLGAAEYTCQTCDGGQNATKQLSIKQLPPVLPIHLKVRTSPVPPSNVPRRLTPPSASNTPNPPPPNSKPKSHSPSP